MTDRRKFLRLLGVGAVSAPLAAKEMLDSQIGDLAIRSYSAPALAQGASIIDDAKEAVGERRGAPWIGKDEKETLRLAKDYLLKNNKLPAHVEEWLREDAQHVSCLDPDIANKRSWSMAVKIQTQRQRNYEARLAKYRYGDSYAVAQSQFEKLTGFKWPW